MTGLQQCYNRGCGKQYDPDKNTDDSCRHHPGAPFFHDAYKGWSCCNKKSVDFTEFLNIKGCTVSKHSNIKPPEPEKAQIDVKEKEEVIEVRAPIKEVLERPPIDTPFVKIKSTVDAVLKEAVDRIQAKDVTTVEASSSKEGVIPIGTSCKNSGCSYAFTGTPTDYEECQYHPGVAIFHEGLKFWSCCQKRTTDFGEFMAQKGCAYGNHKWFKENEDEKAVQCRYDWHQTATNVIVAIYAKLYHYAESTIQVNPIRLNVKLVFPKQDNATFELDLELRGIIDVSKVKAHMYGSKVEISMPKAEPGSWAKLDFPRQNLPPPKKEALKESEKESGSDDEFNLDDVDTASTGFRLTELASTKIQ